MIEPFKFHKGLRPSREWLEHHYLVLGKTQRKIADEVGCHWRTVGNWIQYHELRKQQASYHPIRVKPSRDWVYHNYIELDKTIREIATELGCSAMPITNRLREYGIVKSKKRLAQNHSVRMSGKNNPAWVDGNSRTYQVGKLRRSDLPEVCQWCGTEDNIEIHHIDHDRANHDLSNLTWLCGTCNKLEAYLNLLEQNGQAEVLMETNRIIIKFDKN